MGKSSNYGRRENNPLSIMGSPNANLPLGRCAANIQRRLQRGKDRRCPSNSESLARNRDPNGDSCCHVLPLPDFEQSGESLGKHHCSHLLFWLQSTRTAWIPIRI